MQRILPQVILIALDMKLDRKGMWANRSSDTNRVISMEEPLPISPRENRIGHIPAVENCRLDSSLTAP